MEQRRTNFGASVIRDICCPVSFIYGHSKNIRLTLHHEIEIVEKLQDHEKCWNIIPEVDLQRRLDESLVDHCPSLEVELPHDVLKENVCLMIPPDCPMDQLIEILHKHVQNVLPIVVYTISEGILTDSNIQEIRKLKDTFKVPFLFVAITPNETEISETESLTESEQHFLERGGGKKYTNLQQIRDELMSLGFIDDSEHVKTHENKKSLCLECSLDTLICERMDNEDFLEHIRKFLNYTLLKLAAKLSEIHNKCLRQFVLSAFDMAREIQITPKRLEYARNVELQLYTTLMNIACEKQEEIVTIIQKTLLEMKSNVAEVLEGYNQTDIDQNRIPKSTTIEIQQLVLRKLTKSVATQIVQSVGCLHDSFTGTLQRCLESLEKNCHDLEGNVSASDAVRQIVRAAYNIDLNYSSSFSVLHIVMDRLRTFLSTFILSWSSSSQNQCNFQWQLHIATKMIDKLSALKLAKTISLQNYL